MAGLDMIRYRESKGNGGLHVLRFEVAKSIEALVKLEMLLWARKNAGLTVE
jgi:hypothetical protein